MKVDLLVTCPVSVSNISQTSQSAIWANSRFLCECAQTYKRANTSQGKRGRGGGNSGSNRDTQPQNQDDRFGPLDKGDMRNERFEAYYKAQNILPDDEWVEFMDKLKAPLPTTFRVAGSRQCVPFSPHICAIRAEALLGLPVPSMM